MVGIGHEDGPLHGEEKWVSTASVFFFVDLVFPVCMVIHSGFDDAIGGFSFC
jgi:hypothetical protein